MDQLYEELIDQKEQSDREAYDGQDSPIKTIREEMDES